MIKPKLFYIKPMTVSLGFTVFLCGLEAFLFDFSPLLYVKENYISIGMLAFLPLIGALLFIFFQLTLFIYFSLISKGIYKILYWLVFSAVTLIQHGYYRLYRHFFSLKDFYTALQADSDYWVSSIATFFNPWGLLPACAFALLLILCRQVKRHGLPLFIVALTLVTACGFITRKAYFMTGIPNHSFIIEQRHHSYPATSFQAFWYLAANMIWDHSTGYYGSRKKLEVISSRKPAKNILLIIDESVRGDYLSLNGYKEDTTPFLEGFSASGMMYNWGIAPSAFTLTYASHAVLITGVSKLPDTTYQIRLTPTIFQYAKAMGYRTWFLSANSHKGVMYDFEMGIEDNAWIDVCKDRLHFGNDHLTDHRLAGELVDILGDSTGNFVVAKKYGVHWHYNHVFPEEAIKWAPIAQGNTYSPQYREEIINSYRNAIAFSVDGFFKILLSSAGVLDATDILYTSDHGQTLCENGEHYTQGGRHKTEAMTPMFLVTSRKIAPDLNFRASHMNVFPTLLDMMQVPRRLWQDKYKASLLTEGKIPSTPRYYYYGDLYGRGVFETIPFDADE